MNKFTDDEILKMLKEKYHTLNMQEKLEGRIMSIAAIGKCLYGLAENKEDITYVAYYIPTKEELFLIDSKNIHIFTSMKNENLILVDIRLLYNSIENQDLEVLQSLISPYQYYNIKYEEIVKYDIFTNKMDLLGFNAIKKIIETQSNLNKTFNCFIDYIFSHTAGLSDKEDRYSAEERKQLFIDFIANIINLASEEKTKEETFLQDLTMLENKALLSIIKELKDGEYYLSISNLVALYHISRPVYTTLLAKLKEFKIAIVENKGAKGTYINFFNKQYLTNLLEDN